MENQHQSKPVNKIDIKLIQAICAKTYTNDIADCTAPKKSVENIQPETYHAALYRLFGWFGARPFDERTSLLMDAFYVTKLSHNQPSSVPSKVGLESFVDSIKDARYKNIFLIGDRGVGKSAAVNYLFNKRFAEIIASKATIFRADIAKLHDLFNGPRSLQGKPAISIKAYMILHAFMVALAHSKGQDPALKRFQFDALEPLTRTTDFQKYLSDHAQKNDTLAHWGIIRSGYKRALQKSPKENEDLIDFISYTADRITDSDAVELWNEFVNYLKSPQHGQLKNISLVFDGVDNLHSDEFPYSSTKRTNHEWYTDYLQQLYLEFTNEQTFINCDVRVFSFRTSTYEEFKQLSQTLTHEDKRTREIYCKPVDPFKQIGKRLIGIDSKIAREFFTREIHSDQDKRNISAITENIFRLKGDLKDYIFKLMAVFQDLIEDYPHFSGKKSISRTALPQIISKYVFGDNIRSFSRNLVLGFSAIDKYQKENPNAIISRDQIFESSILAGGKYFSDNFRRDIKGRWLPNVFEYLHSPEDSRWRGLTSIRVLQLTPNGESEETSLTANALCRLLARLNYDEPNTMRSIQLLLDFGLIRPRYQLKQGRVITYEKTFKGGFILWLIQNNLSTLYLMGTNTPFRRKKQVNAFGEELVDKVWLHSTTRPRFFWTCAARTAVQMIRTIKTSEEIDFLKLQSISGSDGNLMKARLFPLDFDRLLIEMQRHLNAFAAPSDRYNEKVDELHREWVDALSL